MPLEEQYRYLLALGRIGELMQQAIEDRNKPPSDGNKVCIVNRGGRLVKLN